ncbi:hypothetical protein WDW37_17630 [Bdellovibrionota bacterium FG-1]
MASSAHPAAKKLSELAHQLKIKFSLGEEPSRQQLTEIIAVIVRISTKGKPPTDHDWADAVAAACPVVGKGVYGGEDLSDLNALLMHAVSLAQQSAAEVKK